MTEYKLIESEDFSLDITEYEHGYDLEIMHTSLGYMCLFPSMSIGIINELKDLLNGKCIDEMDISYRGLSTTFKRLDEDTLEITLEHEDIPLMILIEKFDIEKINEQIKLILNE